MALYHSCTSVIAFNLMTKSTARKGGAVSAPSLSARKIAKQLLLKLVVNYCTYRFSAVDSV